MRRSEKLKPHYFSENLAFHEHLFFVYVYYVYTFLNILRFGKVGSKINNFVSFSSNFLKISSTCNNIVTHELYTFFVHTRACGPTPTQISDRSLEQISRTRVP